LSRRAIAFPSSRVRMMVTRQERVMTTLPVTLRA
jgi:hypothetical protein